MFKAIAAISGQEGFRVGLIATTFAFGFRHGIDWDHIAAITDITGSQETGRSSMSYATLYALGHALVVFVLGVVAIIAGEQLPAAVDGALERVVGFTLVLLGLYVFYALIKHGRDFRMRSRWMLIFSGMANATRWVRRRTPSGLRIAFHGHAHQPSALASEAEGSNAMAFIAMAGAGEQVRKKGGGANPEQSPADRQKGHRHIGGSDEAFMNYGTTTSFGVGMIHGVGAETPTQVLLFLAAAGAAGRGVGILLLLCFIVGLLVSNSLIALASTFGFLRASKSFALYAGVAVVTGAFSLVIGSLFLFGRGTVLPAIFGG